MLVPMVIQDNGRGERAMDIYSLLLEERIIFIGTPIDDTVASIVIAQLIYLEHKDSKKDIMMYINSPGGSVSAGLAIYDTMKFVAPDISTTCLGMAASMGAVLLAAGTKGKRMSLPNSKIMIHQPLSHGIGGQATDVEIYAKELIKTKSKIYELMSEDTGQTQEFIAANCERDNYMSATEAKNFGLIDGIISKRNLLK